MNWLNTIPILAVAFLAIFLEATFNGARNLLGAQIDLLPGLMVYAGLNLGLTTVAVVAVASGFCFDALSANPFGVKQFTGDRRQDGTYAIPAGETLVLRYRVFIHHGDPLQARVAEAYRQFAAQN